MRKKIISLLILTGCILMVGCNLAPSETVASSTESTENIERIKESNYVVDTAYTGANVPFILYETAFQKSETYVKNVDLLATLSADEVTGYINTATNYAKSIYGNSYLSILEGQDVFLEKNKEASKYIGFYSEDAAECVTMDDLMELYVDNKIDANVIFETDQSLLYKDMYQYILRGAMTITVYEKDACAAYSDFFGIELENGKPTTVVCEIYFVPGDTESIVGFEILSNNTN